MKLLIKIGKISGRIMFVLILIGLIIKLIPTKNLTNTNLINILKISGPVCLDLGLLFIAINALYVNILNKSFFAMALELVCCISILLVDFSNVFDMRKGNIIALPLVFIFICSRVYTFWLKDKFNFNRRINH